MSILSWIIALPLLLGLIAQVAFLVVGLAGLGSALSIRFAEIRSRAKLAAPRT